MNKQSLWLFETPFISEVVEHSNYRNFEQRADREAPSVVLKSPRFRDDSRLQAAANNRPPMRQGEQGAAVQKLQQALIDLGFSMPTSTRRRGTPDGIYGAETVATVRKFQQKYGLKLKVDGVVGRNTMSRLDQLFTKTKRPYIIPVNASSCGNLLIWINAFIPRDILGYTFTIPAGPHKGKTAIPCPDKISWGPFNINQLKPNCPVVGYLTDQRFFDPDPTASARMRSIAEIQLMPPRLINVNDKPHISSGTVEINKSTGVITCIDTADMKKCKFSKLTSSPPSPSGDFLIKLSLTAAASDPCIKVRGLGTNFAADIDYEGKIEILCSPSRGTVEVRFNGKIDKFPAFEMYASLNGITKELFPPQFPPKGNTVENLFGPLGASIPVSGKATFDCSLLGSQGTSALTSRTLKTRSLARIR